MTIYSLYIFDRHCDCVYYQSWHRTTPIRAGKDVLPGVAPDVSLATLNAQTDPLNPQAIPPSSQHHTGAAVLPSTRLQEQRQAQAGLSASRPSAPPSQKKGLPFDEESKLIYGVLFSLRSMVKKLSTREEEAFIAYRTSSYKLHLFETLSGYKFVLFSDANVESLRFVLKSIYQTAFVEFVVRNPMITMDSKVSGKGIDNQAFRQAVHSFVSSLSVFR